MSDLQFLFNPKNSLPKNQLVESGCFNGFKPPRPPLTSPIPSTSLPQQQQLVLPGALRMSGPSKRKSVEGFCWQKKNVDIGVQLKSLRLHCTSLWQHCSVFLCQHQIRIKLNPTTIRVCKWLPDVCRHSK